MKAYLAGPMQGIPQFNFPHFDRVAMILRVQGWDIVSPSELDSPEVRLEALASPDGSPLRRLPGQTEELSTGQTWGDFLARDVKIVADQVDAIVVLSGWRQSKGANLEAAVGLLAGKKFYEFNESVCAAIEVSPDYIRQGLNRVMGR